MVGKSGRRVTFPPEVEELFDRVAARIAAGVMAGLERSGLLEKLGQGLEQPKPDAVTEKPPAEAAAKLPPLPLKPEVALGLLMGKAASRRDLLASRKLGQRRAIRPTVTYRVDPRRANAEPATVLPSPAAAPLPPVAERAHLLGAPLPPPPPARLPSSKRGGTRGVFALLYEEKGRKVLAGLINQLRLGRNDLIERLNEIYRGMPGVPLQEEDALRAVHYHNLTAALFRRESEIICRQLGKMRGSLAKTAQKLKLSPETLNERIQEIKLGEEVARIRNQFCEEILERMTFRERLELALTRAKYLADLNIEQQVDALLRQELKEKMESFRESSADECRQIIIRELGLDEVMYDRLMRRYGLSSGATAQEPLSVGNSL